MDASSPTLGVLIPTRNRTELLRQCLRALLSLTPAPADILIVDQSDDDATGRMLAEEFAIPGLRHLPSTERGLSRARNLGLAHCHCDLVAFLDDDCVPAQDWVAQIHHTIAAHPDSAAWIGAVEHGPDSLARLLAPPCPPHDAPPLTLAGRHNPWARSPNGGNVIFRRAALNAVGPYDPLLGQGSAFPGAEDGDILYRLLVAGYAITWDNRPRVAHLPWRDAREDAANYRRHGLGFGAWAAKYQRQGDPFPLWRVLLSHLALRLAAVAVNLLRLRPQRVARHWNWALGMIQGYQRRFRHPPQP
ncbi:MAG: glycosyltransferase family 2 protein [Magnetococcus sp. WYHC-3]